jgi:hypothetical protein
MKLKVKKVVQTLDLVKLWRDKELQTVTTFARIREKCLKFTERSRAVIENGMRRFALIQHRRVFNRQLKALKSVKSNFLPADVADDFCLLYPSMKSNVWGKWILFGCLTGNIDFRGFRKQLEADDRKVQPFLESHAEELIEHAISQFPRLREGVRQWRERQDILDVLRAAARESHLLRVIGELAKGWQMAWECVDSKPTDGEDEFMLTSFALDCVAQPECLVSNVQLIEKYIAKHKKISRKFRAKNLKVAVALIVKEALTSSEWARLDISDVKYH